MVTVKYAPSVFDYLDDAWKTVRSARKKFAKSRCETCGRFCSDGVGHHILSPQTHPALAYDIENVRYVCRPCHDTIHHAMHWPMVRELIAIGLQVDPSCQPCDKVPAQFLLGLTEESANDEWTLDPPELFVGD